MAQELYPQFANEQQLGRSTCKNLSHNLSVIFVSEQKKKVSSEGADSNKPQVVRHNTVAVLVIEATKVTEISGQQIWKSESSFRGANLIIARVEDVSIYSAYFKTIIMILPQASIYYNDGYIPP